MENRNVLMRLNHFTRKITNFKILNFYGKSQCFLLFYRLDHFHEKITNF